MAIEQICQISNCNRIIDRHGARGYCTSHYKRFLSGGDLTTPITVRLKRGSNTVCTIEDCPKKAKARELCAAHYALFKKHGDPLFKDTTAGWGDPDERLWSLIEFTDNHWTWQGAKGSAERGSYGVYRGKYAHRVLYEKFIGPIPKNFVIDHICRVHDCVNPVHLRAITRGQNADANRIKTHCPRGHAYDARNTYIDPKGGRRCRTCMKAQPKGGSVLISAP
jgi:hypothetical protein